MVTSNPREFATGNSYNIHNIQIIEYLSDARRVPSERRKTILRLPIKKLRCNKVFSGQRFLENLSIYTFFIYHNLGRQ